MKHQCVICGKDIGLMTSYVSLKDKGRVCNSCVSKKLKMSNWSLSAIEKISNMTTEDVVRISNGLEPLTDEDRRLIDIRKQNELRINSFVETDSVDSIIRFSDVSNEFIIGKNDKADIFPYSSILEYELLVDDKSVYSGSYSKAFVGGLLFGEAGAIVGGTAKKKEEKYCKKICIKIILRNTYRKLVYVDVLNKVTLSTSERYRIAMSNAERCMALLSIACDKAKSSEGNGTKSGPDEIRQYKALMDEGIITPEEFEAKKKQILGL